METRGLLKPSRDKNMAYDAEELLCEHALELLRKRRQYTGGSSSSEILRKKRIRVTLGQAYNAYHAQNVHDLTQSLRGCVPAGSLPVAVDPRSAQKTSYIENETQTKITVIDGNKRRQTRESRRPIC